VYGAAIRIRARRHNGAGPRARVPVPVVSVGNITAGGTGKTPFVRWCAEALAAEGRTPAIALRGYRAHGGLSDEAEEYRALLPAVPLAVGANRARTIAALLARRPDVDCVVLDDGFQHRGLARDLDIVLVDATRPGLAGRLLPAGWLREPSQALRRADAVVVTRAERVDSGLSAEIERAHGRPPLAWTRHAWQGVDVLRCSPGTAPTRRMEPVEWLRDRRVVVALAIGNPAPFMAHLRQAGAEIVEEVVRRDHAPYTDRHAARLVRAAISHHAGLVTSLKDWTKLGPALVTVTERAAVEIAVPHLAIEFVAGLGEMRRILHAAAARAPR
jgi:tetraacyldisaccharide 4'-kinase